MSIDATPDPQKPLADAPDLHLQGDLFGTILLMRQWGRIGTYGRVAAEAYASITTALAALEHVQPQSMTRILNDLETSGLIVREPDSSDRRQLRLDITSQGRALLMEDARRQDACNRQCRQDRQNLGRRPGSSLAHAAPRVRPAAIEL